MEAQPADRANRLPMTELDAEMAGGAHPPVHLVPHNRFHKCLLAMQVLISFCAKYALDVHGNSYIKYY